MYARTNNTKVTTKEEQEAAAAAAAKAKAKEQEVAATAAAAAAAAAAAKAKEQEVATAAAAAAAAAKAKANANAKIKEEQKAAAATNPIASSSAASTPSSAASSEGFDYKFYGALITIVVGIGCLIASIVLNVQMGGGTNNNQEFKQHLPAIFIPACIGAFILFIGIAIFIVQTRPSYALYGLLAVVCISLGISVAALSTSVAISQ